MARAVLRLAALSVAFATMGGAIGYLLLPERAPEAAGLPQVRVRGRRVGPVRDPHAVALQIARAFLRDLLGLYRSAFGAIDRCPKPVVAAMQGVALGGGFELALACDLRVAAAGAVVGLPETTLAIIPGAGGTQRLARLIGPGRAKELILLGRRVAAHEALALGLLTELARPGETAVAAARRLTAGLVTGAPIALAAAMEAIDLGADLSLDEGFLLEARCYEKTLVSADRREALAAFAEGRKPQYRGV